MTTYTVRAFMQGRWISYGSYTSRRKAAALGKRIVRHGYSASVTGTHRD